jgi:hypothetical protein
MGRVDVGRIAEVSLQQHDWRAFGNGIAGGAARPGVRIWYYGHV